MDASPRDFILSLVLAKCHETPLILFSLSVNAVTAADQFAESGTARLAINMFDEVDAAAKEVIEPDWQVWVVVGDREEIEEGIRELGVGPIEALDADG